MGEETLPHFWKGEAMRQEYTLVELAEAAHRYWFMDDFGTLTHVPDVGLLMGFICEEWDFE